MRGVIFMNTKKNSIVVPTPLLVTAKELARFSGIGENTIRRLMDERELDYLAEWLERHGTANLRPSTKASYQSHIRNHINPYIGDVYLGQLTPGMLDDMFAKLMDKGLSPSSVKYAHRIIGAALEHARKYHYIESNPARDVITKFGKQGKTPDPYPVEEMRQLLAHTAGTDWEMLVTMTTIWYLPSRMEFWSVGSESLRTLDSFSGIRDSGTFVFMIFATQRRLICMS